MTFPFLLLLADLAAITILAFPLYLRRHHRRGLATAFVVLNVAVFAVAAILGSVDIGLGVGMGLFGVLSIIRLRSSEISHVEIAYYFSSLALGLVAGLPVADTTLSLSLMALIVVAVAVVDSPFLLNGTRRRKMKVPGAFATDDEAREAVESLLGHPVRTATITNTDFITGTTTVDVRWNARAGRPLATTAVGARES